MKRDRSSDGTSWMLASVVPVLAFVYWMFQEPIHGILWWSFGQ